MIGLAIDPATNDLFVDRTANLALVYDAEAVGQHVRQRLKTFQGEWFLDTEVGMPWLKDIFGKAYNPALSEAIVKAEILDTKGVVRIETFAVSFDRHTRGLLINGIEILTVYDEATRV